MPRRTRLATAALVGVVALLAGCSDQPKDPAPGATAGGTATTAAPGAGPTSATSSPSPTASATAAPQPTASESGAPEPTASESTASEPGVEPSRPVETATPRRLDQPARAGGFQVSLVSLRAADIKASSSLDHSGAGVLVRLRLRNTSSTAFDSSFVQVAASSSSAASGALLSGSPTRRLAESVAPGASAEGTYAFVLPGATSGPVTVLVYVTSGQPVLQFRGQAS